MSEEANTEAVENFKNKVELSDFLQLAVSKILEMASARSADLNIQSFNGVAVGFLFKTAIALAKQDGCPRAVLNDAIRAEMQRVYIHGK